MAAEPLPPEVVAYYATGNDGDRLVRSHNQLERARTEELLRRHLPPPPRLVLDLAASRAVEREPALLGASPHLPAIARRT